MSRSSKYPEQFGKDAVVLAGPWGGVSASEQEELWALRERVAELELEKEIPRKAAAYFAKEMGR
ncbi:hypothetical protein [Amycolatopsis minnesotensis]|uniref:Transposase n=1 Tax=Amycolatopsis minnesotensis TaxID=337894 RepID=A0ABN2R8H0_9PSEU